MTWFSLTLSQINSATLWKYKRKIFPVHAMKAYSEIEA